MQNLGLTRDRFFGSDQSQPGSALDAFVQAIFPPFAVMGNAQAMFDPKYAPGTYFGLGQDVYQEGKGLLGGSSTPQGGLLGQSPWDAGSYVDMGGYGYGTIDGVGVEDANYGGNNSSHQSDYSGVSWDNMTEEEASSWDSY